MESWTTGQSWRMDETTARKTDVDRTDLKCEAHGGLRDNDTKKNTGIRNVVMYFVEAVIEGSSGPPGGGQVDRGVEPPERYIYRRRPSAQLASCLDRRRVSRGPRYLAVAA